MTVKESARKYAKLTSWGRGFGIREEHHSRFAFFDKLLQRDFRAIVGLDFPAEAVEVDGVTNVRWAG